MSFMNAMHNEMLENYNESVTENGAVGYRTTGKYLLDLNFAVASLRSASESEIIRRFKAAYTEDKLLAIKWLFFARDIRGGLGERRLFRTALKFIADYEPNVAKWLIGLVQEYGRYDDLLCLLDSPLCKDVLTHISSQLQADIADMNSNRAVSLLAKWLPSCNASSRATKKYAKIIYGGIGMTEREYRKTLSALRKYIDVVEVKMSDKRWTDIKYEAVPSRANLVYNDAFLRNDEERRRAYLANLERGEVKINAGTLYPHDIVHKYTASSGWRHSLKSYDATLENLWKALPDLVDGCGNTIVVADGSGSMQTKVGNTDVSALEVANALAVYFSERSSGEFKNRYITFSNRPQFVDFSKATTLRDKLAIAGTHNEVSNTNVEAVFDLILSTAVNNKMRQEDIPANVLIISDMEFDGCAQGNGGRINANLFKTIERKYTTYGYKLPRLVFWNVNSRTNTIPVRQNDMGVALVSGFSVNICKMVMSGKTDPYECLLETLNSERYRAVEEALK